MDQVGRQVETGGDLLRVKKILIAATDLLTSIYSATLYKTRHDSRNGLHSEQT